MKKNLLQSLLGVICLLSSIVVFAKTEYDFNSASSVALREVKNFLQNHCSVFIGFNINANGWNPRIEGDGAMVSESKASLNYTLSPVLSVGNNITVAFSYKFNRNIQQGARRWLKICLADANNVPQVQLDSIEFADVNTSTVYTYNKTLTSVAGPYKLYISYNGVGGSTAIAIDQLEISASKYYSTGCNSSPVAINDHITGGVNRFAEGDVISNDSDADDELAAAYLITQSSDGHVELNMDGSFRFIPNPGFKGSSTSFTYKICDRGWGTLCSNDAKVTISFPESDTSGGNWILPQSLVDFQGFYRNQGNVELSWITNFEQNTARYDVERSLDGIAWHKVGSLKAQGVSAVKKSYSFTDEAGRNRANKKDLYYRLKQIDLENNWAYSKILVMRVYNTHSLKMISVTPNPAKNDIAVNTQLNENSFLVMKVINNSGGEVMKKSLKADAGAHSYMLEGTSKLQPGMYVLEVIVNSRERMLVSLMKE